MSCYDANLQQLQEQVARRKQLWTTLEELREQQRSLSRKVRELEKVKRSQENDVTQLEGRSLAALLCRVTGKMEEALTREREEACAAQIEYDAAVRELAAVEEDLACKDDEYRRLRGCEEQYARALEEKAAALKATGGETAEEILRMEERLAALQHQKKELQEAVWAGKAALRTMEKMLSSLDSAGRWATWDVMGGDIVSDLVKYNRLDGAQALAKELQIQLRRFKTELADVTLSEKLQVNGFLRFADYFFDAFLADLAVMNRIRNAQQQVRETKQQIEQVLLRLKQMIEGVNTAYGAEKARRDQFLCETAPSALQ